MDANDVTINIPATFPRLECSCGQVFVLINVYSELDDWVKQESAYYCPYCGKEWEDKP